MLLSVFLALASIGVVGLLNAAQVALTTARRNRLEGEAARGSFGSIEALRLMERLDGVVASIASKKLFHLYSRYGTQYFSKNTAVLVRATNLR